MNEDRVLCGANAYVEKFYINPLYGNIPKEVLNTLESISVGFVEEIGGILLFKFNEQGILTIETRADEGDYLYDEIEAGLRVRRLLKDYEDLFEKLTLYYQGMKQISSGSIGRR